MTLAKEKADGMDANANPTVEPGRFRCAICGSAFPLHYAANPAAWGFDIGRLGDRAEALRERGESTVCCECHEVRRADKRFRKSPYHPLTPANMNTAGRLPTPHRAGLPSVSLTDTDLADDGPTPDTASPRFKLPSTRQYLAERREVDAKLAAMPDGPLPPAPPPATQAEKQAWLIEGATARESQVFGLMQIDGRTAEEAAAILGLTGRRVRALADSLNRRVGREAITRRDSALRADQFDRKATDDAGDTAARVFDPTGDVDASSPRTAGQRAKLAGRHNMTTAADTVGVAGFGWLGNASRADGMDPAEVAMAHESEQL